MPIHSSTEDRFGTFGAFAIDYVKNRFQCDAFVIGVFGPPPGYTWRPLIEHGASLKPDSPLLQDFVSRAFSAAPAKCMPFAANSDSTSVAPHELASMMNCSHELAKGASLLLTGLTKASERYLAVLIKKNMSTADFQRLAVSQLQSCVPFQSFVRGLIAAGKFSQHIEALEGGYDALHFGALFADERGNVHFLNYCGRKIMDKAFGRQAPVASGRHSLVTPACSLFVVSLLEAVAVGDGGGELTEGHARTAWRNVPHFDEMIPFYLVPVSSGQNGHTMFCVVFPDPLHEMEPELILTGLGLTASESRLASHIVSGHSLKTASNELALTEESARTYLKRVFSKLGISRQAELVSTVARLCSPIRTHSHQKSPARHDHQSPEKHVKKQ